MQMMIRAYVARVLDRRDVAVERIYADPAMEDLHVKMDYAIRQLWGGCDLTDHRLLERTMVTILERALEMRDSGRRLACDRLMLLIFAIKMDDFMSRYAKPPTFARDVLIDVITRLLQRTSAWGDTRTTLIRWGCYCIILYIAYLNI